MEQQGNTYIVDAQAAGSVVLQRLKARQFEGCKNCKGRLFRFTFRLRETSVRNGC